MQPEVERLGPPLTPADREGLTDLLIDAVAGNASVGFPAGLTRDEAAAFWAECESSAKAGRTIMLGARVEGRLRGTVQLKFSSYPNSRNRAEVSKLLVHSSSRRQGLATLLMNAAEAEAKRAGRTLLVLDTETGSPAETLYEKMGWTRAGVIPGFAYRPDGALRPTSLFYKAI